MFTVIVYLKPSKERGRNKECPKTHADWWCNEMRRVGSSERKVSNLLSTVLVFKLL